MRLRLFCVLLLSVLTTATAFSQSNERPGTDVALGILGPIDDVAHIGTFPNGTAGLAMETTSCNYGTVDVPWLAPMNADHPFICFLVAKEDGDRMIQISDYSYVKHGFFALSNSQCIPCENPSNGTFLGVGCSDTYSIGNNASNFYLAPPDEIDPWLGLWDPICSHFDMGEPPVSPPFDCDGNRSSLNPPDAVGHRIRIKDSDMDDPTDTYYYQGYYVVRGELAANRKNNLSSRIFNPTWNGSSWNISVPGVGNEQKDGTVLNRWTNASITQAGNGGDDGEVYLGSKPINIGGGFYRYEYAVHNRDNGRGIKSINIPVCPQSTVQNFGFHDIDDDPGNDWTVTVNNGSVTFSTTDNPLRWNSIFNFWFECDAPIAKPVNIRLEEFEAGPGEDFFIITGTAPMGPNAGANLGFETPGTHNIAPELRACGDFNSGGTGYIQMHHGLPSNPGFLIVGLDSNPTPFLGGTIVPLPWISLINFPTDAAGEINGSIAGGGGPLDLYLQYLAFDPGGPEGFAYSNAIRVTFGP